MRQPHRHTPAIAIATLALLAGIATAQLDAAPPPTLTDDPDAVVITYGEVEVTLAQFDAAFDQAARSTAIGQGLPVDDEVLMQFEPFRAGFLQQYGTQLVLADLARATDVAPGDAEVDALVTSLRNEQPDDAAYDAWLVAAGYGDEDALRATIAETLAVQAYVDTIAADIEIGDAEVAAWYDANPEAVTTETGERMPLEAVEGQIAQLLVQEAIDAEVERLVADAGLELHPAGR